MDSQLPPSSHEFWRVRLAEVPTSGCSWRIQGGGGRGGRSGFESWNAAALNPQSPKSLKPVPIGSFLHLYYARDFGSSLNIIDLDFANIAPELAHQACPKWFHRFPESGWPTMPWQFHNTASFISHTIPNEERVQNSVWICFGICFGFLSWYHLPCICNSLELESVIVHGICYMVAWLLCILHGICYILAWLLCILHGICYIWPCSPSILHGICHVLALQPLICMVFATFWYFKRSCGFLESFFRLSFRASFWVSFRVSFRFH